MATKVLITGAGGFLGTNLIKSMAGDNRYEVWATTSNPEELSKHIEESNIHCVDRMWPIEEYYKNSFDFVINCAYPRNTTGYGVAQGLDYIEELFKCLAMGKIGAIINISSQSVYDDQRTQAAEENAPICLKTPYAVGKYMVEKLLDSICVEIPHTNIRMASLIGPGFDQRIVNRLIKSAIKGEEITITKSERRFGFLDIADAVNGIFSLMQISPNRWYKVYNLGNGEAYTVVEIMRMIVSVFRETGLNVPHIKMRESQESGSSQLTFDRLYSDTGYRPKHSLAESTKKILDYQLNEVL